MRFFNIAGPCAPSMHYMLPAVPRLKTAKQLIEMQLYFVIHAPRQSGKTTCMQQLAGEINRMGERYAVYCSLEKANNITELQLGINSIANAMKRRFDSFLPGAKEINYDISDPTSTVQAYLQSICSILDHPLVLFLDEVDSLAENVLLSLLRQLRDGFVNRNDASDPAPFPSSIALVGMRNIRDYKVRIRPDCATLGSSSPFNIISEAMTLPSFTLEDVRTLYAQHTAETGQIFENGVEERVMYWTSGQPWLVNAVAYECIFKICGLDTTKNVTVDMVDQAVQSIILNRPTHVDSLLARLEEPRVRRIVQPVITGDSAMFDAMDNDLSYVLDLGILHKRTDTRELCPSNRIYAEMILRYLSSGYQMNVETRMPNISWILENGLDMDGLLRGFQQFWRENSEMYTNRDEQYTEALPHLVLMGFLQRVINGGGRITREYALGRRRLDLRVDFRKGSYPIELKIKNNDSDSLTQILDYMDSIGSSTGWLVIFDRAKNIPWEQKIGWDIKKIDGKLVNIVRV